jgi:hypothetical protein
MTVRRPDPSKVDLQLAVICARYLENRSAMNVVHAPVGRFLDRGQVSRPARPQPAHFAGGFARGVAAAPLLTSVSARPVGRIVDSKTRRPASSTA